MYIHIIPFLGSPISANRPREQHQLINIYGGLLLREGSWFYAALFRRSELARKGSTTSVSDVLQDLGMPVTATDQLKKPNPVA
jgi:hypothetical protein